MDMAAHGVSKGIYMAASGIDSEAERTRQVLGGKCALAWETKQQYFVWRTEEIELAIFSQRLAAEYRVRTASLSFWYGLQVLYNSLRLANNLCTTVSTFVGGLRTSSSRTYSP